MCCTRRRHYSSIESKISTHCVHSTNAPAVQPRSAHLFERNMHALGANTYLSSNLSLSVQLGHSAKSQHLKCQIHALLEIDTVMRSEEHKSELQSLMRISY